MASGSVTKRCTCRDKKTGRELGAQCPDLGKKRHGTWTVRQELATGADGERRLFRRKGYDTQTEGQVDLDRVRTILAIPDPGDDDAIDNVAALLARVSRTREPLPDAETVRRLLKTPHILNAHVIVADYLDMWLANQRGRKSGIKRYEMDVRCHLKPHLGHVRLDKLSIGHVIDMFDAINEANDAIAANNAIRHEINAKRKTAKSRAESRALCAELRELPPFRRTTGTSTQKHIKATLRAALNRAISPYRLITFNPAAHVEIADDGRSAKALVWTDSRVEYWEETGLTPSPVMVWMPEQVGQFLDTIVDHELYAMWHLMAYRGLRRGEACGVRWMDLNEIEESLTIATQLVQDGWDIVESAPKTKDSHRTIALDAKTLGVLRRHRKRQLEARMAAGETWTETGRIFTNADGSLLHPGKISKHFNRLVEFSDLPPVRLHDLRHVAATIHLAAGVQMKVVQEMLGHSSDRVTSKFYTSVLPQLAKAAAEKGAPRSFLAGQHRAALPSIVDADLSAAGV